MIKDIQLTGVSDLFEKDPTFSPVLVTKAVNTALNKATAMGKTAAMKDVRARYNVKLSDISPKFKINKSNWQTLQAELKAESSDRPSKGIVARLPLIVFGAKQSGVNYKRQTKKGEKIRQLKVTGARGAVSVEIIRGSRKTIAGNTFITKMKSGHIAVMERTQGKRLPIRELTGIDAPLMFAKKEIIIDVTETIEKEFARLLIDQYDRLQNDSD